MSTTTAQNVVVVEEKKRRKGALLWVAGGAALLLGGSTFALWSNVWTSNGGNITAGDLRLDKFDTEFWDVSSDRKDATLTLPGTDSSQLGHHIDDINAWRIVPGDKVATSMTTTVTLEGDNLVARLSLEGLNNLSQNNPDMHYSYEIYSNGQRVTPEAPLPGGDMTLAYLSAPGAGQDAGLEDADGGMVLPMMAPKADYTVVVYGSFFEDHDGDFRYTRDGADITVDGATGANLADALNDLAIKLEQVRDMGAQFS